MRIRLEQVDDSGEAEHVCHRKDALGDQGWVVIWPLTSWQLSRMIQSLLQNDNLEGALKVNSN
jgi:hypothetical protein